LLIYGRWYILHSYCLMVEVISYWSKSPSIIESGSLLLQSLQHPKDNGGCVMNQLSYLRL
jgi:hypothetical protein